MPYVTCYYTKDLNFAVKPLLQAIESTINAIDSSAGLCKSRAYPAQDYLHPHVYLEVAVLRKPHRDKVFMENLVNKLKAVVEADVPAGCHYALSLDFVGDFYITEQKATN